MFLKIEEDVEFINFANQLGQKAYKQTSDAQIEFSVITACFEGGKYYSERWGALFTDKDKEIEILKEQSAHWRKVYNEELENKSSLQSELEAVEKELGEFSIESISDMKKMTALEIELEAVKGELGNFKQLLRNYFGKQFEPTLANTESKIYELKSSADKMDKLLKRCLDAYGDMMYPVFKETIEIQRTSYKKT